MVKTHWRHIEDYHDEGLKKESRWGDYTEYVGLKCKCGSKSFHVLITAPYDTSARCTKCGEYYLVHDG